VKIIQILCDQIHDEIKDSKWYAKKAHELKIDYPDAAKMLISISEQELEHMKILHTIVTTIIADYRKEHGEPPASMLAVYNYLHEKSIEKAAEAKHLIQMFKE
jgi:ferritin